MTPLPRFRFAPTLSVASATLALVFASSLLEAQSNQASSAAIEKATATVSSSRVATDTTVDLRVAARRVIDAAKHAAFITLDASGHPQARAVQPVAPDSSMHVWFATNPLTRKVGEVSRDARATLYYYDPASLAYVSLIGRARIVRARAEVDRHWNDAWTAYYPDRSKVALVELIPERLEVVDIRRGVRGDSVTWHPPTLRLPAPRRER